MLGMRCAPGCLAALCVALWPLLAAGEDFRVDNAVFAGDEQKPSSESTTFFQNGIAYDCMKSPAETAIFDKAADHFVLLNLKRKTRAELSITQLTSLTEHVRTLAARNNDPLLKFLAAPKFEEELNEVVGLLTLSSRFVTYRIILEPQKDPSTVEQYREFCDVYAKLNSVLSPGSPPPSGRLMVNAALAKRQATASSVTLTVFYSKGEKSEKITVRSEHRLTCPLQASDIEHIAKVREQMESFKLVTFDEYRKSVQR